MPRIFFRVLLMGMVLLALAGCETLRYYPHLIGGHLELMSGRRSIDALVTDPETDAELRRKLNTVMAIRRFADAELYLPVNGHYRTYVKLDRKFVTWNVYAAPEFSLEPKTWKYPMIGAAAYRGFFRLDLARDCAAELRDRGYDVYIAGASAYSTLGWFDDPLPSTVAASDEIALASLIFHELAHQILYVSEDTDFNESFATAVAQEGTRRYLTAFPEKSHLLQAHRLRQIRRQQFTELVADFRRRLQILYGRDLSSDEMRSRKQALFADMATAYARMNCSGQVDSSYDAWFAAPLNNAKIVAVSTYNRLVPVFMRLLKEKNGDMQAFYAACRELAAMPAAERRQRLQRYATTTSTTPTTVFKRINRTEIKKIQ